jgi:O-antigen ligase
MSLQFGGATPLLLLIALVFGALVLRYSAWGVPILVTFVYLNLSETLVRYHQFPSLLQFLVVALAFAAWLKADTERVAIVARQRVTQLVLVYLLVVFASTAWAADRGIADERFGSIARAVVLFLLGTLLMRTRHRLMQGVVALVASAAAIGLLILFQVATGQYDNEFGGLARVKDAHIYGDVFQARIAGPNGDPNFFARMLLLAIPPAGMLAFHAREKWQRRLSLAASVIILATLAATYSRGAMVALALMAAMMLHALHVRWQSTAAVGAAMLLVLLLLPASVTQRFVTIEEFLPGDEQPLHPDSSFQERRLLMSVAWVMFGANPIGGVGAGNYTARYDDYVGATGSEFRQYGDPSDRHYPHNLALEIASETGVIGLAAFAALLLAAWRSLSRAQRDEELGPFATAMKIGLAGFLVAGLFLHLAEPRTLFLMLAFAASMERLAWRNAPGEDTLRVRIGQADGTLPIGTVGPSPLAGGAA